MALKFEIVRVTPFEQNCTVLWCDETMCAAVVDPGGDLQRVASVVKKYQLNLERILVTHGHIDHAGGVADLRERFSLPVEGPNKEDLFLIDKMPQQADVYGFAPVRTFVPDRWLGQGDSVGVGNVEMQVLHCPGHTPGHVVFYNETARLALVGDVLFKGSVGRTDFPKGNFDTLINSIREKLWPLGDDVAFIPGHGPISTFGEERVNNPFCSDRS